MDAGHFIDIQLQLATAGGLKLGVSAASACQGNLRAISQMANKDEAEACVDLFQDS